MIFVDDFTRMMWVAFLKEKSKAFEKFKILKNKVENESGVKIKSLRSDRGGEFTSRELNIYYEEHGIRRQLSSPHMPEKNGIAEIRNRSIAEVARDMLFENDLIQEIWVTHEGQRHNSLYEQFNEFEASSLQLMAKL